MADRIDFNCDMGESFGMYKLGYDEEVIRYITSANIACGFHAGDPMWMRTTVEMAEKHGVGVGAQPSFPDLMGFGRRNMMVSPEEARNDVTYQIGALQAFAKGRKLQHVKPHGAMYNMAVADLTLARAICQAVKDVDPDMIVVALAGTDWVDLAAEMGLRVAREAFADRAFTAQGTLVPRAQAGSVIPRRRRRCRAQRQDGHGRKVTAITGEEVAFQADSLCLHGDTPGAVEMARAVREGLEAAGVKIVPMRELV